MLRYADTFTEERGEPDCCGREQYFDSDDPECQRCDYFRRCAEKIRNKRRGIHIPVSRGGIASRRRTRESGVEIEQPEGVPEGRTTAQQFAANCLTGACRGITWEAYQFFTWYRF